MTALRNALLLALPSSTGAPMDTLAVVLALKAGSPAFRVSEERCASALWILFANGLVDMNVRGERAPRWTRSRKADALPVVRERFEMVEAMR